MWYGIPVRWFNFGEVAITQTTFLDLKKEKKIKIRSWDSGISVPLLLPKELARMLRNFNYLLLLTTTMCFMYYSKNYVRKPLPIFDKEVPPFIQPYAILKSRVLIPMLLRKINLSLWRLFWLSTLTARFILLKGKL